MNPSKHGNKHTLLLYKRMMDRLWGMTLFTAIFLTIWLVAERYDYLEHLQPLYRYGIIIAAVAMFGFTVFALLTRKMAYVQARSDHILLATPFLRLKIAYSRLRSVRSVNFAKVFPPEASSWAQRRFLEPFYPETAVAIEMNGFPISPGMLRLFLGPQMFLPRQQGLLFLVHDWMGLSTEIDSRRSSLRQSHIKQPPGSIHLLQKLSKK